MSTFTSVVLRWVVEWVLFRKGIIGVVERGIAIEEDAFLRQSEWIGMA